MKKLFALFALCWAMMAGVQAADVKSSELRENGASFALNATWYTLSQTWNGQTYYWFYDANRPKQMRLAETASDGTSLFLFCFEQNTDGSTYTVYNRYLGPTRVLAALEDGTVGFAHRDSIDASATTWTVVDNSTGGITLQHGGKGVYGVERTLQLGEAGTADAAYAVKATTWVRPKYRIHSAAGSYIVDRSTNSTANLGLSTEESEATLFKVELNGDGTYMIYEDSATVDGELQALDPIRVIAAGNPCRTAPGESNAGRMRLVNSGSHRGAIAMQMRNFDNGTWYVYDYRTANGTTNIWSNNSGDNVSWYFTNVATGENMQLPTARYDLGGSYRYTGKGVVDGEQKQWNASATIDYDTKTATITGLTPGTVGYTLTGAYNPTNRTITIPENTEIGEGEATSTLSALNEATRQNGPIVVYLSTSGRTMEVYDAIEVIGEITETLQGHNVDSLATNEDNPILFEQPFTGFDVTLNLNKVVNSSVTPNRKYYNVKTHFVVTEDGQATVTGLLPEFEGKTFTGQWYPEYGAIGIDYGPTAQSNPPSAENDTLGVVSYQYQTYRGIGSGWKGTLLIFFNDARTVAFTPRAVIVYQHPDPNGRQLTNAGLLYQYDDINEQGASTVENPMTWTDTLYVVPRLNQRADTVPRAGWTIDARNWCDNDLPQYMIDEDASTLWHTNYPNSSNPHGNVVESLPECFTIDLGQTYSMGGFGYMPRPYSNGAPANGTVYKYRVYVSDTPFNINADDFDMANPGGTLAGQGDLQSRYTGTSAATILDENFTQEARGRYVLFISDSGVGDRFASCAEFYLYTGTYNGINRTTTGQAELGQPVRTQFFTTDGVAASANTRGIVIVKKTYANGQTTFEKVLKK